MESVCAIGSTKKGPGIDKVTKKETEGRVIENRGVTCKVSTGGMWDEVHSTDGFFRFYCLMVPGIGAQRPNRVNQHLTGERLADDLG